MSQVSVIIPAFKVARYLMQCVTSVLGQTFSDFELIFVDDGSPDESGEMCDEYLLTDARIIVIHQGNGGLSAARNTGINYAFATDRSRYLTFIDSDDYIHADYLLSLMTALQENGTSISFVGYQLFSDRLPNSTGSASWSIVTLSPDHLYDREMIDRLGYSPICAWSKLYAKELFRDIRYPVGKWYEDRFTTYKVLFQCPRIAISDARLYFYRVNPDGIMHAPWDEKCLHDFEAILQQLQFFEEIGAERAYRATILDCMEISLRRIEQLTGDQRNRHWRKAFLGILKKLLRRYAVPYKLTPDNSREFYNAAFPRRTNWYIRIRSVWRKLKHLSRKI